MSEVSEIELKKQGDYHRSEGKNKEAIEDYTKAIEINSNYVAAYNCRGIAYYNQKKYTEAIVDYTKAIEIDADYKHAYFNRGLAYSGQKKYKEAIEDYTKAIDIDPNWGDAYNSRGLVYKEQGRLKEAIEDYTKAIEIDPDYKFAYRNRGLAYKEQGKYKEAIEDYTKAIEIDPNYVDAYNSRGLAYSDQKKYKEEIEDYTKAIEIDPGYIIAYRNRGLTYKEQGKYKEAIEDYTKAIETDPNYVAAYNSRGLAYYYQKRYKEAIEDYTKAIEIDPAYKYAYNNRGLVYNEQGKYKEAIEDYTKAIEIDPDYKKAYNNREIANKKLGNCEEVKKDTYELKLIEIKTRDENFYKYIEKTENDINKKEQIYDLFLTVMKLKDKLLYKDSKVVGHYTKICNLKHLLKPRFKTNKDEAETSLRLNNVSYMNDPTEGEVFLKLLIQCSGEDAQDLLDNLYNNQSENNREVLNGKNHVFLVSFSTAIDTSLPMWVQYSENGEGCCLVFDSSFFDKEDKNSLSYISNEENDELSDVDSGKNMDIDIRGKKQTYYCLYKIEYIHNDNDKYKIEDKEITNLIEEIGAQLIGFKEDLKQDSNVAIKGIIQNILDQVRFLFKDKNYDHEEEVRLVKFADNGNVQYTGDAEGFRVPHVFVELDKELQLKEIILGPKVQNAIEIANYLYYTEKVTEVSKSRIKYK
jgi:tetratricopeptide (TPR) repeat protein